MALGLLAILGAVVKPVADIVGNWQKKRIVKQQGDIAIASAKVNATIKRLQNAQEGDIAWENTALAQTGIKDEVMMFVILAPMIACFMPGGADLVKQGFQAMNESLPDYWEYAFYLTVGVSYGVRRVTDFFKIKKGA